MLVLPFASGGLPCLPIGWGDDNHDDTWNMSCGKTWNLGQALMLLVHPGEIRDLFEELIIRCNEGAANGKAAEKQHRDKYIIVPQLLGFQ